MRILAHHDVDTFPTRETISRNRRPAHSRRVRRSDLALVAGTTTRKA